MNFIQSHKLQKIAVTIFVFELFELEKIYKGDIYRGGNIYSTIYNIYTIYVVLSVTD